MVNLQALHNRFSEEIEEAIHDVVDHSTFIKGKQVQEFERNLSQYLGVNHVVSCASGTDAITISMMALGLERGDEVIMPSFAYAALPESVLLLGIQPVFIDIDKDYLINIELIEEAITSKTKAIALVHLFGRTVDLDRINLVAQKHDLLVLEDAAQSLGTYFKGEQSGYTGCMGNIGITSFFPSKNLGSFGDGGAILTQDPELAEKARLIANHGQSRRYFHDVIGMNSRLDTIQAAVLNVKLKYFKSTLERRRKVADYYNETLSGIGELALPILKDNVDSTFHQYTIRCESNAIREGLRSFLNGKGIPSIIYYPLPLHQQKAYCSNQSLPVSENMSKTVLSLPICSEKSEKELEYITHQIKEFFKY